MLNSLCGLTEAFLSTAATQHKDNTQYNKDNVFRDTDAQCHAHTDLHTRSCTLRSKLQKTKVLSAGPPKILSDGRGAGVMSGYSTTP